MLGSIKDGGMIQRNGCFEELYCHDLFGVTNFESGVWRLICRLVYFVQLVGLENWFWCEGVRGV